MHVQLLIMRNNIIANCNIIAFDTSTSLVASHGSIRPTSKENR